MEENSTSRASKISECLKNKDYSNPALTGAKIISLCVIALLLLCLFVFVARIDSIEVMGDVSVFNESEIVEASGLRVGGCMYTRPFFVIKSSVRKNLPMVQKVRVSKNLFTGKVTLKVAFSDFEYFTEKDGKFYGLDKDLRVTDIRDSRLEFLSLGAREITLQKIEPPVLGQALVYTDTLDILDENGNVEVKGQPEYKFEYAAEFLNFLDDSGYLKRTNAVFLDEKFNIRAIIDGKYLVYFGKCESLPTKFEVVDAIISEGSAGIGIYGVINVENPALASARVDNTLDLSLYVIPELDVSTETPTEDPTEVPSETPTEASTDGAAQASAEAP